MSNTEPILEHAKITPAHLQRLAFVYVRQSSPRQVEEHRESQANQRQLAERAQALGWRQERIRVIDSDLGQSGQHAEGRSGFNELMAEVSLGHVGIIFGYEVSRLARNNSDWYRLLDLAAMFGSLIADSDGVYDPRQYNDRLVLGLKGTMSEAELHILHLRMHAGRLSKVRKGTYQQALPTGLVRLADGSVVKDPDEQVRHAIELVFAKFAELGSCTQVLAYLVCNEVVLPRRQRFGVHKDEVVWKLPTDQAILTILHNPAQSSLCRCVCIRTTQDRSDSLQTKSAFRSANPNAITDGGMDSRAAGCISSLHLLGGVSGQPGPLEPESFTI